MNKELYELHAAYDKHEYVYTGYCCSNYMILVCSCGSFCEGKVGDEDHSLYETMGDTERRATMSETYQCLPAKLRPSYKAYAATQLKVGLQLRGGAAWKDKIAKFVSMGQTCAAKLKGGQKCL
jgi:hypothetical protein